MLVAPAGYGKSTLARQWLSDKAHVWFEAGDASSDVVGLATALASALEEQPRKSDLDLVQRARITLNTRHDLEVLAELQAKALGPWPRDRWLAIDDYELIARSELAEDYVHLLTLSAGIRLLVTSRLQPRWVTGKALLYSEVCALDARDLAMREEEARLVLKGTSAPRAHDISAFDGWPAVVGLASLSEAYGSWGNGFSRPSFSLLRGGALPTFISSATQCASSACASARPEPRARRGTDRPAQSAENPRRGHRNGFLLTNVGASEAAPASSQLSARQTRRQPDDTR